MANHTPGPWQYDATGRYYSKDGVIRMNGIVVCRMTPSRISSPSPAETAANAHLIAAAPDMFNFIQQGLDRGWFTSTCDSPTPEDIANCAKCQAMIVLTKAKGAT